MFSLVESWVFGREFAEGNLEAASYLLVLFTGLAGLAGTYLWFCNLQFPSFSGTI